MTTQIAIFDFDLKSQVINCRVCKIDQEPSNFHRNSTYSHGRSTKCKSCSRAYRVAHYQKNKDHELNTHRLRFKQGTANHAQNIANVKAWQQTINGRLRLKYRNLKRLSHKIDFDYEWFKCFYESQTNCPTCNFEFTNLTHKHIDHILPVCAGGLTIKANLQILCANCNYGRLRDGRDLAPELYTSLLQVMSEARSHFA